MTVRIPDRIVDVEGTAVRLTTLDRVLFPEVGYTKAQLVDYYVRMGPVLLRHLAGHPVTLHRFPEGVEGVSFFQTRAPSHPPWIRVQRMHIFTPGKQVDSVVIDDLAGIVWAANLSTVEFHPYLARAEDLEHPTTLVFDLDPGPPATILDACDVALRVRDALDGVGVDGYAKVSGGAGVHVVVPLTAGHTYPQTKAFAKALAEVLSRHDPDRVTHLMPLKHRVGRVFVDWGQNDAGKSTVAPYSVRGGRIPTVAMPVGWSAIEDAARSRDHVPLVFVPDRALASVRRDGDVTSGFTPQTLPR